MINRFSNRKIIKNNFSIYSKILEDRDKKELIHYNTAKINFPSDEELKYISFIEHVWTVGDRMYKLSEKYCGDKNNWWIILQFNKIGSEQNIKVGDIIKIPTNLQDVLNLFL